MLPVKFQSVYVKESESEILERSEWGVGNFGKAELESDIFPPTLLPCCRGRRMTAEGAENSQQCHKYFLQHSTFASDRPQVRKLGLQTCFLPWAPGRGEFSFSGP